MNEWRSPALIGLIFDSGHFYDDEATDNSILRGWCCREGGVVDGDGDGDGDAFQECPAQTT